jgi:hypothetical protein
MLRLYATIYQKSDRVQTESRKVEEKVPTQSRRRKRDRDYEDDTSVSKKEAQEKSRSLPVYQNSRPVASRNFFAPLRSISMKGAEPTSEGSSSVHHAKKSLDKGRPSPIILTAEVNIISLQKQLKGVVNGEFLSRNTATGTGSQKKMGDSKAIQTFLSYKGHPYFTFCRKSEKPIKVLMRHLQNKNSSEDITVALQELCYEVFSFKQMTAKRPSPEEGVTRITLSSS